MNKKSTTAYYMRTSHYLQNITTQVDKIPEGARVFKDEGVSGRISFIDRPAGKKLLEAITDSLLKGFTRADALQLILRSVEK